MPELPEVETVRRGLESLALGKTIACVEVFAPRMVRHQLGGSNEFKENAVGFHVSQVNRHGKFLWLLGESDHSLVLHLGMSGQIRPLFNPKEPVGKHERVRFHFQEGTFEGAVGFRFIDQRMFGALHFSQLVSLPTTLFDSRDKVLRIPAAITHIGPDLFDSRLDFTMAARALRQSRSPIKNVLLNQKIVSGFGNIYADEALARAHINGMRPAYKLRLKDVVEILEAGRSVMRASLASGGTSFDALYVDVNGNFGDFADQLLVYGRAGQGCRFCGHKIATLSSSGRTHHFCPNCQKLPRGYAKI